MPPNTAKGGELGGLMGGRALLYLASSVFTLVAGLIMVRLLPPQDYAAFQSLTKRVVQYVIAGVSFVEIWIVRDTIKSPALVRRALPLAASVLGLVGGVSGLLLVWWISGSLGAGLLAFAAGFIQGFRSIYIIVLDSLRAFKGPLARLIIRTVYALLAVLLVWIMGKGLLGALMSYTLGVLSGSIAIFYWLRHWLMGGGGEAGLGRALSSLVGRGRAEVGLYRVVPYVIFNIDVPVIYAVTGDAVLVSVYFASRLIPFTLVDVVRNTFRYLTARLVGGYRAGYAVGYGRAALLLVLPIPVYTLANPVHVLTLLRPEYSWAYRVLQVFSVESVFLLLAIALENVGAGVALRGARHVEMSKALYKRLATASLTYLLLTASTVLWSDTEARIYWWTAATVVYTVLYSIVVSWWLWTIEPQARRELAETYARITAYIILLAPLAYLLGPHTRPYTSFFKELITILPGATVFYAGALIIIAALDARVREAVRELLSGLTRRRTAVMSSL